MKSASALGIGESATIADIADGSVAGRFIELGIRPGSTIKLVRTTLFKRSYYIEVDGQRFALRKQELASIMLENE